jgi:hypothetical protein
VASICRYVYSHPHYVVRVGRVWCARVACLWRSANWQRNLRTGSAKGKQAAQSARRACPCMRHTMVQWVLDRVLDVAGWICKTELQQPGSTLHYGNGAPYIWYSQRVQFYRVQPLGWLRLEGERGLGLWRRSRVEWRAGHAPGYNTVHCTSNLRTRTTKSK